MSNEFEFFQPAAVGNAVHAFAGMLEHTLASLKHDDLLAPYPDDYRVRIVRAGELGLEVDLHLAPGADLTVVVPFSSDRQALHDSVDELAPLLAAALADLDDTLALRAEVERDARARMRRLNRAGVRGQVVAVRLSPIDLTATFGTGRVQVLVEGEACNMLRPFRDEWCIRSLEDVAPRVAQFRDEQRGRLAARDAARAVGAVGFVDPLALVALDRLPEGRAAALRTIARELEKGWYVDDREGDREHVGLVWNDGVVRGVASLGDGVELSGIAVVVRDTSIDEASAGRPAGDFSRNALIADLPIEAVQWARPGYASVRLGSRPIPFTAAGEVLTSC